MRNESCVKPTSFRSLLVEKNDFFGGMTQNDGHELLVYLMDCLHEELKYKLEIKIVNKIFHDVENSKNNGRKINPNKQIIHDGVKTWAEYIHKNCSIISNNFYGVFNSVVSCKNCGKCTNTFDIFGCLTLELPTSPTTIEECLNAFTSEENVDDYECDNCKMKTCTRKISLWYLPNILIIHLNRFRVINNTIRKNNIPVECDDKLTITEYIHPLKRIDTTYRLISYITHTGDTSGGHYTACCKTGEKWNLYNDSHVASTEQCAKSGYLLVYEIIK